MRNDVCFVSVGQCGGNIGVEFERLGYDVFYMNTAKSDLDALQGATHVYCIPRERGCNQDPEKAKGVFADNAESIVAQIKRFATKRLVYFLSSCGGGTSGMTPLVAEHMSDLFAAEYEEAWAKYENGGYSGAAPLPRKVGIAVVLPSIGESAQLNANAYNFMKEIVLLTTQAFNGTRQNMASTILIDNERGMNPIELNGAFASLFDEVMNIPTKHKDVRGNVDEADLESAFAAPGVCVMSKLPKKGFSVRELVDSVRHSSIFADTEETSGMYWVSSTTEPLGTLSIERELGAPRTHFMTYNDECELFVVSGMGFPTERLSIMATRAKGFQKTAIKTQQDLAGSMLDEDLDFMNRQLKVEITRPQAPARQQYTQPVVTADGRMETKEVSAVSSEPASSQPSLQDKLAAFKHRRRL